MPSLSVLCLLYLMLEVNTRNIYYPIYHEPSAIVFEGPTNYNETHQDNKIENPVYDIDIRFGKDECPPGFEMVGTLCFPND
ncbi:unnamed protein product [Leptosia nina]|uniref:Uncharacterized protein n=1 Tax=Leptosia nina TaxID=320188 RepID=A0AAV1K3S8_9NEOP